MKAKFAGRCARTGQSYPAGTEIVKGSQGWELAGGAHVAEFRAVEVGPIPAEFGGQSDKSVTKMVDVSAVTFCSCCKKLPGFNEADPSTFEQCRYDRKGDILTCRRCGRTVRILSQAEKEAAFPPETHTCWECGREFTYAECKKWGGDWNENGGYCGC